MTRDRIVLRQSAGLAGLRLGLSREKRNVLPGCWTTNPPDAAG
jgi:hypothetical protein